MFHQLPFDELVSIYLRDGDLPWRRVEKSFVIRGLIYGGITHAICHTTWL